MIKPEETGLTAISVGNLTVRFGQDASVVTALQDVSFAVPEGQLVTMIGPSGCDNSTPLRAIADLVPIWAGSDAFRSGRMERTDGFDAGNAMTTQSVPTSLDRLGIELREPRNGLWP